MDPATASLLERAARAITDSQRLVREMEHLRAVLAARTVVPHSAVTYSELRTFVHGERGKTGGSRGRHDDRVVARALTNIGMRKQFFGEITFF
jgi:hypothetical protein